MAQTQKQKIGELGENIAVKHFVKHSFGILDRNYRKKWGEIDIVAKKDGILHFIEVKTVSYPPAMTSSGEVGRGETKPEENIHFWKRKRLSRVIQTYLADKKVSCETDWQVDSAAVFLNPETKQAKIRVIENIIL
jgi:putative endonuclease